MSFVDWSRIKMPKIEAIKKEYDEILKQLSNPELISDRQKFEKLTKRKNFLEKIIEKEKEIQETKNKIEENKLIISAKEDAELESLAQTEQIQLMEKEKKLKKELAALERANLSTRFGEADAPSGQENPQIIIVEIRAGTGGEEATLFVSDLYRMYSRYASLEGWKQKVLDSHPTGIGGFKEIIFELKNGDIWSKMQYEGGVHRVQRIPLTEKMGRIHTSTTSVAILPKPKKAEIKIRPGDLKINFYRASGPGGQYVNKRETAVRLTHLPTGLVVTSQAERNQLQNKENALAILEARLQELKKEQELKKIGEKRKAQIKWAKRAEKIRTYNFPQDRVTDHRIKKSFHHLEEIMAGKLDSLIKTLQSA